MPLLHVVSSSFSCRLPLQFPLSLPFSLFSSSLSWPINSFFFLWPSTSNHTRFIFGSPLMIVRSSLEYTTQRQEISKELVAGHNFAEGLPKKSEIKESAALKVKTTVRNFSKISKVPDKVCKISNLPSVPGFWRNDGSRH